MGDWFNLIAIFTVLSQVHSSAASVMGGVLIIKQLPFMLVSPFAGVVADRFSRRSVMMLTDLARALVVLLLLLTPLIPSLWFVYPLLIIQAVLSAFFEPARSALLLDVVDGKDLVTANALGSIVWSTTLVVGAGLGGLATELFGWQLALVIDSASYLLSAFMITGIAVDSDKLRHTNRRFGIRVMLAYGFGDLKEFSAYLRSDVRVRVLTFVKTIYGIGGAMVLMLTVFGQNVYGLGKSGALGITVLYSARGLGALAGPVLLRYLSKGRPHLMRESMFYCFIILSLSYMAFSFCNNIWLAALCVALAHMMGGSIWFLSTSLLQIETKPTLRGRVFGFELGLFTLSFSLSTLLYGFIMDHGVLTPQQACFVLGASWLIPAVWWYYTKRIWGYDLV